MFKDDDLEKRFFTKIFFPDAYHSSIFEIDPVSLKDAGIRGLLIDLDNTLLPRNEREIPQDLKDWILSIQESGLPICVVSNNWGLRVSNVAAELNLPLVAKARKPLRGAFLKGMKVIETGELETAVVGDQIFTDIYGGNRLNLYTILVVPMSSDHVLTKILRFFERIILKSYKRKA